MGRSSLSTKNSRQRRKATMENPPPDVPKPSADVQPSSSDDGVLPHRRRLRRRMAGWFLLLLLGWLGFAYLLMPLFWKIDESRHPSLTDLPNVTRAADNVPGDP